MKANQHCRCIWINALCVSWAGGTTWLRTGLLVLDSSKQIHSSHRSEAAGSDRVGRRMMQQICLKGWQLYSQRAPQPAWSQQSPHRVLVQRPQTRERRPCCCTLLWGPAWIFHSRGYGDSVANTLQENTATSKALGEGKSWGCWGSSSQHCVQSPC